MDETSQSTVTRLLKDLNDGNSENVDLLFEKVYETLKELSHLQRRKWDGDFTLNTTALVHEAYLKLVDQSRLELKSRAHFLSVSAKVMRHLLIDYARQRKSMKRGGEYRTTSLDEVTSMLESELVLTDDRADVLLTLDDALKKFAEIDERASRVVECRFFAGMSIEETAAVLDVSPMTVKRDWAMGLAWLRREMLDSHD